MRLSSKLVRFGDLHKAWITDEKSFVMEGNRRGSNATPLLSKVKLWICRRRWRIVESPICRILESYGVSAWQSEGTYWGGNVINSPSWFKFSTCLLKTITLLSSLHQPPPPFPSTLRMKIRQESQLSKGDKRRGGKMRALLDYALVFRFWHEIVDYGREEFVGKFTHDVGVKSKGSKV